LLLIHYIPVGEVVELHVLQAILNLCHVYGVCITPLTIGIMKLQAASRPPSSRGDGGAPPELSCSSA
jgi:hypothetical protein